MHLKIAESQFEGYVHVHLPRAGHGFGAHQAHVESVLVGAGFRHAHGAAVEADADHLHRASPHRLLEGTAHGKQGFRPAAGSEESQHDGQAVTDRQQRLNPGHQVTATQFHITVEPVVVGRQVEFAGAAGNRRAAADVHQPLVLAQVLPGFARHGEQRSRGLLDFVERAGQCLFGNLRIVAEGQQDLALAFEFLDQVDLEVGAACYFKDLEQGDEGDMVFERAFRPNKMHDLFEKVFQPEQRADPLVERIFVGDHARA